MVQKEQGCAQAAQVKDKFEKTSAVLDYKDHLCKDGLCSYLREVFMRAWWFRLLLAEKLTPQGNPRDFYGI